MLAKCCRSTCWSFSIWGGVHHRLNFAEAPPAGHCYAPLDGRSNHKDLWNSSVSSMLFVFLRFMEMSPIPPSSPRGEHRRFWLFWSSSTSQGPDKFVPRNPTDLQHYLLPCSRFTRDSEFLAVLRFEKIWLFQTNMEAKNSIFVFRENHGFDSFESFALGAFCRLPKLLHFEYTK